MSGRSMLVVSAHPGDFVWRAGGAIALSVGASQRTVVACLSYGERGESAQLWLKGADLAEVKRSPPRGSAAGGRGAGRGDPVLRRRRLPAHGDDRAALDALVALYREVQPSVVLTHGPGDPYNGDHPAAGAIALRARQLAQAVGVPGPGDVIGAPPVFFFEPHQPEVSGFRPDVLLDITPAWERKRAAMEVYVTQRHLWEYYTDLGRRRGVQLARNSGPNLGKVVEAVRGGIPATLSPGRAAAWSRRHGGGLPHRPSGIPLDAQLLARLRARRASPRRTRHRAGRDSCTRASPSSGRGRRGPCRDGAHPPGRQPDGPRRGRAVRSPATSWSWRSSCHRPTGSWASCWRPRSQRAASWGWSSTPACATSARFARDGLPGVVALVSAQGATKVARDR